MNANELFSSMETDFNLSSCHDDWSEMRLDNYITENYKDRYMGVVTDNTDTIRHVYTAVFPTDEVIQKLLDDNAAEALLFVHHPMQWDITRNRVFRDIPEETMQAFKERKISIYNLHVPLDANGPYGTTYNFAKALGIDIDAEFYEYCGVKVGIIGHSECGTVSELKFQFETAVGHSILLYPYGADTITDQKVALIAGGGNDKDIYPFLKENGINTYLTGIASERKNYPSSVDAHHSAKEKKVNILAGTHYSTEKFACIKMVEYFEKFGLTSEFISGKPCMEDM